MLEHMPVRNAIATGLLLTAFAAAQEQVSFPTADGGTVYANIFGNAARAVVLAHGGRFNKESWTPQAKTLVTSGFRVMAIDFRGYGKSTGPGQANALSAPLDQDVLAAVRYLHQAGAKTVSVVGASMGGSAAAQASIESEPGEIDRLVMLAAYTDHPEKLKGRTLFIVARGDANAAGLRLPKIQANYDHAPEPKKLVVLNGSAHAQFLFSTTEAASLMSAILSFLSAP